MKVERKCQVQIVGVILITGVALALAGSAYFWGMPLIQKSKSNVDITQAQQFMEQLIKNIEEVGAEGGTKVMNVNLKGTLKIDSQNDIIEYTLRAGSPSYTNTLFVPLNDNIPYKKETYIGQENSKVKVEECSSSSAGCYASYDDTINKIKMSGDCKNELDGKEFGNGEEIDCTSDSGGDKFIVHLENLNDEGFWFLEGENEIKMYGIEGVNKPLVLLAKTIPTLQNEEYIDIFRIYSREVDDPNTHDGKYYDIESTASPQAGPGKVTISISRGNGELTPGGSELGGDLSKIKINIAIH